MARLVADSKMGYYPTPPKTLACISEWIHFKSVKSGRYHLLDPCCGEGEAISEIGDNCKRWGIELDAERGPKAYNTLDGNVLAGCSIFDARINPLGCMGLFYLNPPYDTEEGKRVEMEFLKHSMRWLAPGGLLVFIIPETVFLNDKIRQWIGEHFYDITVVRSHTDEYPDYYRQAVLFGRKREERVEDGEPFPRPPYPHIEKVTTKKYAVPITAGPRVFQSGVAITDEEIIDNRGKVLEEIKAITGYKERIETLSPVLPLRKGHLVSLITAGVLDGRIKTEDNGFLLIKGFSDRIESKRTEEDKEITTNTYSVGIRVIESTPQGVKWYDIR